MKAKKIVALMIGVVSLVGISVPAKAETYAPVDSSTDSSRYYTETYTVNRGGISYKGNARRRTGFMSSSGYTLDGNISIVKPVGGKFSLCSVDCVFVTGMSGKSMYNSSVFNTPTKGISTKINSSISVMKTISGKHLYDKSKSVNDYKFSNFYYADTTEQLTVYGTYRSDYRGLTHIVHSYVTRY